MLALNLETNKRRVQAVSSRLNAKYPYMTVYKYVQEALYWQELCKNQKYLILATRSSLLLDLNLSVEIAVVTALSDCSLSQK